MTEVTKGGKKYWFKTYRINKGTDNDLKRLKKKSGKNWNEFFKELIKLFNQHLK